MTPMAQPNLSSLFALFLVSAGALGFEVQLTRYFAIASWSEYGYWIISIVMVGLSLSGVALSLLKDLFVKRGASLLALIPGLLMLSAVLGYWGVTLISFNPLEFQNHELWQGQLICVGQYYLVLFPFFFLSGLYIGLNFILYPRAVAQIYAFDLLGAAAGSLGLVFLMIILHPFYLLPALLPLLLVGGWLSSSRRSFRILALVLFCLGEIGAFYLNQADYCQYKAIYPPLHVEGNRIVQQRFSPRGLDVVLDNFTERLDIDLSNNYSLLKVSGPPSTLGLYRDGTRLESLPKDNISQIGYAKASLDILPYLLRPGAKALVIGTRGGFKIPEIFSAGASQVVALEPDPVLYGFVSDPTRYGGSWFTRPGVTLLDQKPLPYLKGTDQTFDIIDLSAEFLDQGQTNRLAFTQQALQEDFRCLRPKGIISIPSSIRELTVYALKTLESAQEALQGLGVPHPEDHLLLYRSAWSSRLLIFKDPLTTQDLKKIRSFCSDRSFDISYFSSLQPGKQEIWNEIPPMVFAGPSPRSYSREPQDALRDDCLKLISDPTFKDNYFFNLTPSTYDRPFFYSVLRLSRLRDLWRQLALIPREEIGYLVNLAVLAQSLLFAALILLLPWVFLSRSGAKLLSGRFLLYFPALGLGFLFLEIYLIEKASFLLGDQTLAFSLVLGGMLFFSGLGSWFSSHAPDPAKSLRFPIALILGWCLTAGFLIDPLFAALLPWSILAKSFLLLALLAPLSFGLGMPFALGSSALERTNTALLPWAWALNGAFSVIATPLANILAVSCGFSRLLFGGLLLYVIVWLTFPRHFEKGSA